MGVERFARKSFGFVVVLLLGLAIYFQAAGTVELVASSAFAAAPAPAGKARRIRRKPPLAVAKGSTTNGDAILARNPFDSVTGPLDRTPLSVDLPEQQKDAADVTDPLHAPECEDVAVNIITESPDPAWSLAQLKGPGDPDAATRRVGDDVGKMKVAYIGYNAEKGSPAVWLLNSEKLCQALLFSEKKEKAEASAGEAAPAPPPAEERAARRAAARTGGAGAVPPEIAAKIH
jgi:general secretion pathway protein C